MIAEKIVAESGKRPWKRAERMRTKETGSMKGIQTSTKSGANNLKGEVYD